MVTFEALARPAIRRMAGFDGVRRALLPCRVEEGVRGPADVVSFLRVVLTEDFATPLSVRLSGPQGSSILSSMIADGLLILPEGMSEIEPGGAARMLPLRELFRSDPTGRPEMSP
jgi:molybdopterin molybdotransferase